MRFFSDNSDYKRALNQNQKHGARTGQHEQPKQQAQFRGCSEAVDAQEPRPTRMTIDGAQLKPECTLELLRQGINTFFAHPDRIEITAFTLEDPLDRDEKHCEVCGTWRTTDKCPDCSSDSSDLAGDEAYETWRDRQ